MGTVYEAFDPDLNRRVALKLVRQAREMDARRLLREAQALAQLQHPSVVAVHDVGMMEDGVFIAMALVAGENLREHLARTNPSWRRALSLYVQAGRGLAAAHEKSIVHRDFKPANVLVDREGRVRVTDFGLARLTLADQAATGDVSSSLAANNCTHETIADYATVEQAPTLSTGPTLLASPLTHEGALLGTPRYMAPEQHARRPANARSDQYSFCVCVWEAVFGMHPFSDGHVVGAAPSRASRTAPRWLVRVLERGLSFEPGRRHPTMTALLDALERAPRIRRRVWAAAAGLAAVAAASIVVLRAQAAQDPCSSVAPLQAWTHEARVATRAAFVASGLSFAATVHDSVSARLDHYADAWRAMKVETCRAHVAATQSEDILGRRNLCLDRREDEVGALVAAMRVIPREQVEKAADALANLADLSACSDPNELARGIPLPQDPERAEQIRALEREIANVEARHSVGRPADRSAEVAALVARARAFRYSPALLRALALELKLAWDDDRFERFVELAQQALIVAEAAGDDRARFRIHTDLVEGHARLQRYDDAARSRRIAEAILERFGHEPALAAEFHCAWCFAEWQAGNYQEALRQGNECVAQRERVEPRNEGEIGRALQRRAVVEFVLKRSEEGIATATRAVELMERAYGKEHPVVADALTAMGAGYRSLNKPRLAEPLLRRAVSILETTRGDSSELTAALQNLANMLLAQHRHADAIALYRRVLSIGQRKLPAGDIRIAATLDMLGKALAASGEIEEGEATALRAIALREANGKGHHPSQAVSWRILGGQYRRAKRYEKSIDAYTRALLILERKYGRDHHLLVPDRLGIAEAELHARRPRRALPWLERAFRHLDAKEMREERARQLFLMAQALWSSPRNRVRARRLASDALEQARADDDTEYLPQIDAWLQTHAVR